jgi:thymidylate synthase
MDLQVMRALQNALAGELGLGSGEFIYFSSSLHAYASQAESLQQLQVLMNEDAQWQM